MIIPKNEKGAAGIAILLLFVILIVIALALAKMGYFDLGEFVADLKGMFW